MLPFVLIKTKQRSPSIFLIPIVQINKLIDLINLLLEIKMSRNKDKYENTKRAHTFMSREEAISGKCSQLCGIEITGGIRNLSMAIWNLEHITSLYLNDNCLQRLPADIGRLINLRSLDISSNKLRSLPSELGDLIQLRYVVSLGYCFMQDICFLSCMCYICPHVY